MGKKSIVALALILVLGKGANVNAENVKDISDENSTKIEYLLKENIINGYDDGDLKLNNKISRAEIVKLIVTSKKQDNLEKEFRNKGSKFKDISKEFWANGYINVVTDILNKENREILTGYIDGSFKPNNNITFEELSKILYLSFVDDDIKIENVSWPMGWINLAEEKGILNGVDYKAGLEVNREEAFVMLYNSLNLKNNTIENKETISYKNYNSGNVVDDKVSKLEKENSRLEKRLKEYKSNSKDKSNDKENKIDDLNKKLDEKDIKIKDLEKELKETKDKEKEELENIKQENIYLNQKINEKDNIISKSVEDRERLEKENKEINNKCDGLTKKDKDNLKLLEKMHADMEETSKKLSLKETELVNSKNELEDKKAALTKKDEKIKELKDEITRLKDELENMKENPNDFNDKENEQSSEDDLIKRLNEINKDYMKDYPDRQRYLEEIENDLIDLLTNKYGEDRREEIEYNMRYRFNLIIEKYELDDEFKLNSVGELYRELGL